jgi:hypothetical protein
MNKGIPTKYEGVQFRSRIEARWAAMFDALTWAWDYEPIDLNGYIPDFILKLKTPVLVEIKSSTTFEELKPHKNKILHSGWEGEIVIAGATLHYSDQFDDDSETFFFPDDHIFGFGYSPTTNEWSSVQFFNCIECKKASFFHDSTHGKGCRCSVTGCVSNGKGGHLGFVKDYFDRRWANASNHMQWKSPQVTQ